MDLCQFFTAGACSEAVVAELDSNAPQQLLDVAAGHGSLSNAAVQRWTMAKLATLEIDHRALDVLRRKHPRAEHMHADLLGANLPAQLEQWIARADVLLCNPPFRDVRPELADRWLSAAGMPNSWSAHIRQRAEVVFLAHNIRMLRPGGELAMILPAAFVSGEHFKPFRAWLLDSLSVTKVVQLSRHAFIGGQARAFAIIARNSKPKSGHRIELVSADESGNKLRRHTIDPAAGIERLDPGFYQLRQSTRAMQVLNDFDVEILRGKPVTQLDQLGLEYFHTTDFANGSKNNMLQLTSNPARDKLPHAEAGDVLVGRVGRQCFRQVAGIAFGGIHFSDCILRIRSPAKYRKIILESLLDPQGQSWRQSRLRGSAAQFLSRHDLLAHPIWQRPME